MSTKIRSHLSKKFKNFAAGIQSCFLTNSKKFSDKIRKRFTKNKPKIPIKLCNQFDDVLSVYLSKNPAQKLRRQTKTETVFLS
jgi:hypothetical protein